jgi:hypothetical protein
MSSPPALIATCPACTARLEEGRSACSNCGAPIGLWDGVERTPLILPGNPALSIDVARHQLPRLPRRAVIGAGVAAAIVGALYFWRDGESGAAPAPQTVASAQLDSSQHYASGTGTAIPAPRLIAPPESLRASTQNVPTPEPPAAAPLPSAPVLEMSEIDTDSLRPGSVVTLRGDVVDQNTGRTLSTPIEYTTTDSRIASVGLKSGIVVLRQQGRARIIASAAGAASKAVELTVRAATRDVTPPPTVSAASREPSRPVATAKTTTPRPTPPAVTARPRVVVAAPARTTTPTATVAQSAVVRRTAPPPSPSPTVTQQSVTPSPISVATTRAAAAPPVVETAAARNATPGADDIRGAAERIVRDMRGGAAKNAEVAAFLADGAEHRVALAGQPAVVSTVGDAQRVVFAIRLTKFDGGGRPVTRIATVSMEVAKRDAAVQTSAVSVGELRRP